ncbi:MAG: peroxiredoxin-like family protein [Candidatus Limnocylindrales bacterium]
MPITPAAGELTRQLRELAARTPAPIAERISAILADVTASGVAPGLAVGERAPNFRLPNAAGEAVELAQRLATGPVVLSFYRGEWCPYCNLELRALQAALPRFQAHGAALIAISPQSPDHSLSVAEKNELSFDVLSDVHQVAIRAFRVQFTVPADLQDLHRNVFHNDLSARTADGSWDLPIPATFVIDRGGIIRARYVSADYRTRMDPEDIEAALAAIG